jgi:geranylgeranyl pyrophosphate synthase
LSAFQRYPFADEITPSTGALDRASASAQRADDVPVEDFDGYLEELKATARGHVAEFLPATRYPALLKELVGTPPWSGTDEVWREAIAQPSWHLLSRGGKQWRSILGLLALECLGVPRGRFDKEAVLFAELIHTGTLLVDDIEDESKLRRGAPAAHLAFGTDIALNAGNALYFLPMLTLDRHPLLTPEQRDEIYRAMIAYFARGHMGQALDIYLSRNMTREKLAAWIAEDIRPQILDVYRHKTSSQAMALAELACIVAATPPSTRTAFREFCETFGIAFQIMDDVHGLVGMPGATKTPGEDISAGKLTYVMHTALSRLEAAERERLGALLVGRPGEADSPELREALDLVEQSGAPALCHREANDMLAQSWGRFSPLVAPSRAKTMIRLLCAQLLQR